MDITNDFLKLNYDLVLKLKEQFKSKANIKIANGYVRCTLKKDLYQFVLYATKEKTDFEIISRFFDKLSSPKEECSFTTTYITAEETENWNKEQKNKYIKKTMKYITTLTEYAENTGAVIEHYTWDYNFEDMILDFVRKNEEKEQPLISEYISSQYGDCYCMNGFILYVTKYSETDKLDEHIEFLKKMTELEPLRIKYRKKGKKIEQYFEKYFVGSDTDGIKEDVLKMYADGKNINQIYKETNHRDYELTIAEIEKIIAENQSV